MTVALASSSYILGWMVFSSNYFGSLYWVLILPAFIDWIKNQIFFWKNITNWTGSDSLGNLLVSPL